MDPVSFQLDMGYGSIGTIINCGPTCARHPGVAYRSGRPGSFILLQAYGSIAVLGKLTLDFGKFYTTAGAEVLPANKNWLYSRSILFNNIPLLHTGARANFKVNDMLSLQASVVNGWNDDPDFNAHKTFGLSATITAGPDRDDRRDDLHRQGSAPGRAMTPCPRRPATSRILVDLVAALTFSDKLGVNLNFDYIKSHEQRDGLPGRRRRHGALRDQRSPERRGPRRVRSAAQRCEASGSNIRTSWKAP